MGGHYRAGETLAETLREVEEEIGISTDGLTLRPLGVRVCANDAEPGFVDRELQDVFALFDDRPLDTLRPDPTELSALARFELKHLLPLLAGENPTASGVSLSAADHGIGYITVTIDDFIPSVDRYFFRVAIAVDQVLRGERYVSI